MAGIEQFMLVFQVQKYAISPINASSFALLFHYPDEQLPTHLLKVLPKLSLKTFTEVFDVRPTGLAPKFNNLFRMPTPLNYLSVWFGYVSSCHFLTKGSLSSISFITSVASLGVRIILGRRKTINSTS